MKTIRDWIFLWLQTMALVVALIFPTLLDVATKIKPIINNTGVTFDTIKYYYLMKLGNGAIGIVCMFLLLIWLRKDNSKRTLNKGNLYHDHCYVGYLFCAKILGYKKCSLIRVPIAMQFKLVINDTFCEYDYGPDEDYRETETENIKVESPKECYTSTVNIVLSDTYPVTKEMLPESTINLSTIWISRDNEKDFVRCYSKSFCEKIQNTVRQLPNNVCEINLYPTLNPKHSAWIARNVFKMGGRTNIKTLTIYPQLNENGNWNFSGKGIIIYKK